MKLTLILIFLNLAIFFFSLTNFEYFIKNYGFNPERFLEGEYYIILTSLFLHGSLDHLVGNMVALFFLGSSLEKKVGKLKYTLAYFFSGIVGNLSFFIPFFPYPPHAIGIGASGAISGLIGLGTLACPGRLVILPPLIPLPFVVVGALYFLSTYSLLFKMSKIAYPAHLCGLFAGFLLGLIWGEKRKKRILLFLVVCLLIIFLPSILSVVMR